MWALWLRNYSPRTHDCPPYHRICWPFLLDQPTNSAHLSCNLKVAFELVEVRIRSDGLKPMLRNGRVPKGTREAVGEEFRQIIDACRGEQGEELRRNAKEVQRKFKKAWEDGGEAKRELNAFLERYFWLVAIEFRSGSILSAEFGVSLNAVCWYNLNRS